MEWGQQMRKHEQVSRDAMYHNSNYTNSREIKIPLIIDIEESSGNQKGLSNDGNFSVDLMEPLIIDDLSDKRNELSDEIQKVYTLLYIEYNESINYLIREWFSDIPKDQMLQNRGW